MGSLCTLLNKWDILLRLWCKGNIVHFIEQKKQIYRRLLGKKDIAEIAESLNMSISNEGHFDSGDMQDGEWEIHSARELITKENIRKAGLNEKVKDILLTEINLIGDSTKSLDTYWCIMAIK